MPGSPQSDQREGGLYGTANCRPLSSSGRAAGTRPHQHDALPRDVGRGVPLRRGPEVVHRTPGLCVASEHLLGLHPAFGLLPAAGASSVPAGSRRLRGRGAGHSRHPALPARGHGAGHPHQRRPDAAGQHGADRCQDHPRQPGCCCCDPEKEPDHCICRPGGNAGACQPPPLPCPQPARR